MRFSIIVPAFRVEKYIEDCLNSIKAQSFSDFECIVVDDGSDDQSPAICDRFAASDSRFTVIHKKNGGVTSARKAGSDAAKGEYIVCVDGDDFIAPNLLETLDGLIKEYSPDTVCYGGNRFTDRVEGGFSYSAESGFYSDEKLRNLLSSYIYDPSLGGINDGKLLFYLWSKCVYRDLFLECQDELDNKLLTGEDAVFTLAWCKTVRSVYISDFPGYFYRSNPASLERSFRFDCFEELDLVTEEMHRIDSRAADRIDVYYFYRALKMILVAAQQLSYREYMDFVRKELSAERMNVVKKARLSNHTAASRVKCLLLQNGMWRTMYLLANTWFAGKFG